MLLRTVLRLLRMCGESKALIELKDFQLCLEENRKDFYHGKKSALTFCCLSKRQCGDARLRSRGSQEASPDTDDSVMTRGRGGGRCEVTSVGQNGVGLRCPESPKISPTRRHQKRTGGERPFNTRSWQDWICHIAE